MRPHLLKPAADIILASSSNKPADSALRQYFRLVKTSREDSAAISNLVFTYFRWLGWLNPDHPLPRQLKQAEELQAQFDEKPGSFSDADLSKAIPGWANQTMDVTPAWLRSLQTRPTLWLRANNTPLEGFNQGPLPYSYSYLGEADLFRTPEFNSGLFEIQDLASQAVGHLCAPQPSQTVWDACAGEGGKTLHLSALMQNKGLIWATDKAEWRLKKLKQRAARARAFNYRTALWDGSAKLPTKTKFDLILIDAPCSGIGTWGRNPHARWTTTEKDVQELAVLQTEILRNAIPALKPGGKLVYSVCTLAHAETIRVAETIPLQAVETQNPLTTRIAKQHWIWNHEHNSNGMFIACWHAG